MPSRQPRIRHPKIAEPRLSFKAPQIVRLVLQKNRAGRNVQERCLDLRRFGANIKRREALVHVNTQLANRAFRKLLRRKPGSVRSFQWKNRDLQLAEFHVDALIGQLWGYVGLIERFFIRVYRLQSTNALARSHLDRLYGLTCLQRRALFPKWKPFLKTVRDRLQHESTVQLHVDPLSLVLGGPRYALWVETKMPSITNDSQSDKFQIEDFFQFGFLCSIVPRIARWSKLCEQNLLSLVRGA
jgi:hypothetical protein